MKQATLVGILLRVSIASVFLYAAIAATVQPNNWVGFIPQIFYKLAPISMLLLGFSFYQLVLALWILTGWKGLYSALLASLTLLAIIVANFGDIDILFRDFAIFFASLALAVGSYKRALNQRTREG